MADDRPSTPLIDLAAVVVAPALVMLMVGSLVFFLIEVLYAGQYSGRLLYTMFFFVFGAVLIARLSIETSRAYAGVYAAGLGGAVFLAMTAYVEYPPGPMKAVAPAVNLLLMALVWWAADKLTWDCTHLDEDRKASGRGLLAATGIDQESGAGGQEADEPEDQPAKKRRRKKPAGWLERFQAYREEQKKKAHTPGTWVLYFSLAALPLFALGQSVISPDDAARRRATFLQMAVYVGSGLGLLVTTSLLGLRKYLEERNARIPPAMTAAWLGLGGGLIVAFLAVGAVLPRPHSETPLIRLDRAGKADREASRYAAVRDEAGGKGAGAAGRKTEAGKGKGSAKGGEKGGNAGEKGSGGGKGDSQGGNQRSGDQKGGQDGGKAGQGNDKGQGKAQQGGKQKGDQSRGQDNGAESKDSGGRSQPEDSGDKSDAGDRQSRDADADKSESDSQSDSGSSGPSKIGELLESAGGVVKWVVWVLVAVAVVVGLAVFVLKWLAPFTDWARNLLDWLRGLFGRPRAGKTRDPGHEARDEEVVRPPPFAAFSNPFADGTARRRAPAELAAYTFAALDAWAWDRGRGRQPGETPTEFAARLGHEYGALDEPGFQAAALYARVLYSRSPVPADAPKVLAALWRQLDAARPPAAVG